MENEIYEIGATVWAYGKENTITSGPFELYGGEFQNATNPDGKEIVIITPRQNEKDLAAKREERKIEQAGFARLKATAKAKAKS